jgi:hypothetical protein
MCALYLEPPKIKAQLESAHAIKGIRQREMCLFKVVKIKSEAKKDFPIARASVLSRFYQIINKNVI